MTLDISPIYAGLLALLFLALSARVIRHRQTALISVGSKDDLVLLTKMRVQANWAEYAPIGIILLVMAELQGAPDWAVHVLGAMLLIGRVIHAVGMSRTPQRFTLRVMGMLLTLAMIALAALANVGHALI